MSQKTLERLEYLRKSNSNSGWVNNQLYRLMYKEDLYIVAYERIKSKPGNMTAGTDKETLDGFSLETIREIIQEMKTEQFQFKPVRMTFIPKANGKMRKLGIPCVRDKVVQEVIRMILEAIYDSPHKPYFSDASHGFRPGRSCHTALREIRGKWTGINWLVEGDIRACFDEIDHTTLVTILKKKIQDQRFLNLIWKLLNAGYMDLHGNKKESLIGSPQGSLVTLPTMWQTLGMMIGWSGWGMWPNTKNHVDLLLIHFDTFDQRANNFPTRQPISFSQPFFDLGCEGF